MESGVGLMNGYLLWTGFSCAREPGQEDSNAGGVTGQISGNLSCPVRGKEKVVPGALATANDDGVAVCW